MAQGDTNITVVGNIVADPELRFTPAGAAVANFRVASTPRRYNSQTNQWEDGEAMFLTCNVWRQAAENVAKVEVLEKAAEMTHLFSVTGGDPAINGEYVFMDVSPEDMSQDSAIFQIGDFNSWEILEQTKDHVLLKVSRSWVDDPTGEIKSTEEKWKVPMVKADAKELTITIEK